MLMYHSIKETEYNSRYQLSKKKFEYQLSYLLDRERKYKLLISFDDGLKDNYTIAKNSLEKFGLKATFFISTGLVGEPNYMTKEMIEELDRQGHRIAGHGHLHLNYLNQDDENILKDLTACYQYLQENFNCKNLWFSYPYGARNKKIDEMCAGVGFKTIFSSSFGTFGDIADKRVLPRIEVWNSDTVIYLERKIEGKYDWLNLF